MLLPLSSDTFMQAPMDQQFEDLFAALSLRVLSPIAACPVTSAPARRRGQALARAWGREAAAPKDARE